MMRELKPKAKFSLNAHPPFDFYSTVESEIEVRRMEGYPPLIDHFDGHSYWTTLRLLNGQIAGICIESNPPNRCTLAKGLHVTLYANSNISEGDLHTAQDTITHCWGLNENMTEFFRVAQQPPAVRRVIERHRGLRALTWQEPFQTVCIAILLQNATVARTNAMIAELIQRYGIPTRFGGLVLRHWFSAQRLAEVDPAELRSECRLGFRAERLSAIAKALANGCPDLAKLNTQPTNVAKEALMKLKGIGEYSAEFVLTGMRRWDVFPVDVWSARQFHRVLFPKQPVPPIANAAAAVRKRAQELWGDWRGLVWNFILHELDQLAEESEQEAATKETNNKKEKPRRVFLK